MVPKHIKVDSERDRYGEPPAFTTLNQNQAASGKLQES